ncbi:hypothetical protein GCM10025877_10090 [Agromyces mangrovi Wang et al. 2018]|nr:hypothetical protein GCM10025877_10090 [Agromyces mangrovi]
MRADAGALEAGVGLEDDDGDVGDGIGDVAVGVADGSPPFVLRGEGAIPGDLHIVLDVVTR